VKANTQVALTLLGVLAIAGGTVWLLRKPAGPSGSLPAAPSGPTVDQLVTDPIHLAADNGILVRWNFVTAKPATVQAFQTWYNSAVAGTTLVPLNDSNGQMTVATENALQLWNAQNPVV
jgi:hypothetical protein